MTALREFKATTLAGQPFELQSLDGKPNAHPLYQWLKDASDSGDIEWNFVKFLVGRDGEVLRRYPPKAKPEDIAADIDTVIAG